MHPDFNPPGKPPKLTGRKSTLTGLFFTTLTPFVEPNDNEVREALHVLGMTEGNCVCAYCGDAKSEWDHFRPIVVNRKPTGYITEIANLVPSCGKCNQSKGNKPWKSWMTSGAALAPAKRGIKDLEQRIARLEAYENWSTPTRIEYEALLGLDEWQEHLKYLDDVLSLMEKAESSAARLRANVEASIRKRDG